MFFSIFGIIIIVFFVIFFLRNMKYGLIEVYKKLFTISIVSTLILDVGYFMKVGSFIVEYNYVFSIMTLCVAIFVFLKLHIYSNVKIHGFLFLLILVFVLFVHMVFNIGYVSVGFNQPWDIYFSSGDELSEVFISSHSFFVVLRTAIFLFNFYIFVSCSKKTEFIKLLRFVYRVSILFIIISLFDFFTSNFIRPTFFREISFILFGKSEATYYVPRMFLNIYVPMAFLREPSSFCYSCMIFAYCSLAYFTMKKNNKPGPLISLFLYIVLLIISKSLTGFIYAFVLYVSFIYISKRRKMWMFSSIFIFLIFGIVLYYSLGDRVNHIFSEFLNVYNNSPSKLEKSSEIIRLYSIVNNIKCFFKNPLFGCGIGSIYSYSAVITMLCDLGLVGTFYYAYIITNLTNRYFDTKFTSCFSIIIIALLHLLTGHLSYILYLDRIAFLYLVLKYISISKRKNPVLINVAIVSKNNIDTFGTCNN